MVVESFEELPSRIFQVGRTEALGHVMTVRSRNTCVHFKFVVT